MESTRVQAGSTELIKNDRFVDSARAGITGLSAKAVVYRNTSPRFWDGAAYQTTPTDLAMTAIDATNLPGEYIYSLNTTGMSEEEHFVIAKSGTSLDSRVINDMQSGSIWIGGYIDNLDMASSAIADDVWDEDNTNHLTPGSMGASMMSAGAVSLVTQIAASPAPNASQFALNTGSAVDDFYNDMILIDLTTGQPRVVSDYVGSTKLVTLDEAMAVAPSAGDTVVIRMDHVHSQENIAATVWNAPRASHVGSGTFGQAVDERISVVRDLVQALQTDATSLLAMVSAMDIRIPADPASQSLVEAAIGSLVPALAAAGVLAESIEGGSTITVAQALRILVDATCAGEVDVTSDPAGWVQRIRRRNATGPDGDEVELIPLYDQDGNRITDTNNPLVNPTTVFVAKGVRQ